MRKGILGVAAAALAVVLTGSLAACSNSTMNLPNAASYGKSAVKVGDWKMEVKGANVVYDESSRTDDIIIYVDAKNEGSSTASALSDIMYDATQNGASLSFGTALNDKGELYGATNDLGQECEPGQSKSMTLAYALVDYSEVQLSFSKVDGSELDSIPINVSNLQTNDGKQAQEKDKAQRESNSIIITGAKIDLADGWKIAEYADTNCDIQSTKDADPYLLRFTHSSRYESAEAWANSMKGTYPESSGIDTVTIGANTFYRFYPNSTQFKLYVNSPSGGAIEVYGIQGSLEACTPQIEKLTVQ